MTIRFVFLMIAFIAINAACSQERPAKQEAPPIVKDDLVYVEGGAFVHSGSNYYYTGEAVASFYMGKYEVTQQEWTAVMGGNPSGFRGERLPVEMISWYDAVVYCNQRSALEGLEPYYRIDKSKKDTANRSEFDSMKWTVEINAGANGYRLPTEAEWEYAAGGGQASGSYTYSGSNEVDEVAWYWRNAGEQALTGDWSWPAIENNRNRTHAVGSKGPNELGLYDMSGNVREWCWDWYAENGQSAETGSHRVVRGGGWMGDVSNTEPAFRGKFDANGFGPDQGFRIARSL
ncbi:SUMF1/EgtB/PvdO family nonheme iron enzyme [Paenibacillus sp. PL2-23]|uniref:formylglycine-generating enzyme family protein n=1 Tax=Paenibacillus sp. PL2-23 TaxID=2100729 RepID=UPI0030F6403B